MSAERALEASAERKPTIISADNAARFTILFEDLAGGLKLGPVWRAFAWDETQQRYQRSLFGLSWIVISYAFFVACISLFFGGFSSSGSKFFIQYVALGYATYHFLVGNIVDGCQVFTSSGSWIKSAPLPYSIYVYKSIFRSLLPFSLHMVFAFAVMIAVGWTPTPGALLAIPAVAIFVVNAVALQYLLGLVAARFRAVNHLVTTVTRILIFVTPIMWVREERRGVTAILADLNPATHFVEIFRNPLLGLPVRPLSWGLVLLFTALVWIAAAVAASRMRRRLPFWV